MPDLTGKLTDFALAELIALLGTGKKTGVLRIEGPIGDGTLNFNEGKLIHLGESDDAFDSLSKLVVRLARLPDATFAFDAGVVSVGGPETHHEIDVVLTELARRMAVWSKVEEQIGSAYRPYIVVATADDAQPLELTGADWNLLARLGDGSSAAGLARKTGLDEFEVAVSLVRFLATGLIAQMDQATQGAGHQETGLDGAMLEEPRIPMRASEVPTTRVYLDLTGDRPTAEDLQEPKPADPYEEAPASELAARWRDLRASRR